MSLHASDALILRTWPVNEADLVVSFFTRDFGKLKGVAKSALKSRKRFGGSLEPMTVARAHFADRPRQELVRLDQLELMRSPLSSPVDYARAAVLSFYAEVLEQALPEQDPQETVFRLLLAVLEHTTAQTETGQPWMPLTYFSLWMTRLMGWLPELACCTVCGERFAPGEASFHPQSDGLFCPLHRQGAGSLLSADSWQLAQRMLREPVTAFTQESWPRQRAQDLRRFTQQSLERHLERRLRSADAISRI
jgi:DNA repair protein RecO (recombination protein O)